MHVSEIVRNLDWSVLTNALLTIIPALICITLHELSHGFVAYRLGDPTAKMMGRLTLNPIKHIDVVGLIAMVIFKFGWAKPVPVDMRYFRNPKRGMAITALAGPASNIVIAVIALLVYGFLYRLLSVGTVGEYVLQMIYITAYLSTALAIFNIIPIPPLDGSKVLFSVMSDDAYYRLMRYERYGMILLIVLMVTGVTGRYLQVAVGFVFNILFAAARFAFRLTGGMI